MFFFFCLWTLGIVYIYIPGTPMTSIFEGQPPKTRPFPTKTRVIWVPGIYTYIFLASQRYSFIHIYVAPLRLIFLGFHRDFFIVGFITCSGFSDLRFHGRYVYTLECPFTPPNITKNFRYQMLVPAKMEKIPLG